MINGCHPMKGARASAAHASWRSIHRAAERTTLQGWGLDNFGLYADFAEHIMNTDDPVPSTNVPTKGCYVLDVTKAEAKEGVQAAKYGQLFQ